jgi:hypothetical protein
MKKLMILILALTVTAVTASQNERRFRFTPAEVAHRKYEAEVAKADLEYSRKLKALRAQRDNVVQEARGQLLEELRDAQKAATTAGQLDAAVEIRDAVVKLEKQQPLPKPNPFVEALPPPKETPAPAPTPPPVKETPPPPPVIVAKAPQLDISGKTFKNSYGTWQFTPDAVLEIREGGTTSRMYRVVSGDLVAIMSPQDKDTPQYFMQFDDAVAEGRVYKRVVNIKRTSP